MNESRLEMSNQLAISYIYLSEGNSERFDSIGEATGESDKQIVLNCVRDWFRRHRDYYLELAKLDSLSRGLSLSEWAGIAVHGMDSLPDFLPGSIEDRTQKLAELPPSPLAPYVLGGTQKKRTLNYLNLSTFHLALLRVGVRYERSSNIDFISRIVEEHMYRYWDSQYVDIIAAELGKWEQFN